MAVVYPNGKLAAIFYFRELSARQRKDEVSEMIENRNGTSKSVEKALKNYTQAKQRIANEKKSRTGRNGKTEAVKNLVSKDE